MRTASLASAIRARAAMSVLPLLFILAVAAVVRLELIRLAPPFLVANDSAEYFKAGYTLLTSGEFEISLKRTPLYSLFLAGLMQLVGPSLDRLVAAQHALGLLSVVLAYVLGRLTFGSLAGLLAALGVAMNGSILTMEHLLISEALATQLLLGSLAAFVAAVRVAARSSSSVALGSTLWVVAGMLFGLGALCRPLGVLVLMVVLVALPFVRLPRCALLRGAGLLLFGAAFCVAPWIVRQSLVEQRVEINGGLGDALFSRVRRYDPTFTLRDEGRPVAEQDRAIRARIFELAAQYEYPREVRAVLRDEFGVSDREADRLLREVALTVIAQEPGRFVTGTLAMSGRLLRGSDPGLIDLWLAVERERVVRGWSPALAWARTTSRDLEDRAALSRVDWLLSRYRDDLPSGIVLLALAPLGAAWAIAAHRRSGSAVIPLIVVSQIVLYVALDGPLFRYRYPLQPLITLLGAGGLVLVIRQVSLVFGGSTSSTASSPHRRRTPRVVGTAHQSSALRSSSRRAVQS